MEKFSKLMEWTDEKPEMVFTLPWVFDSVTNRILSWKDKEIYDSIFEVKENKSYVKTNVRKIQNYISWKLVRVEKFIKQSFLKIINFSSQKN